MRGPRLLVVEDDDPTRQAVAAYLGASGYEVDVAVDAASAIRRWEAGRPDAIVLDLGLPDRDGTSVVRHVRRDAPTPILILSARGSERDKVTALEAGADDYVTKPFGMGELRARIRALLRRSGGGAADASGTLRNGGVALDPAQHVVTVGGKPLDLTPREYELLKAILAEPGRVLTRARLLRTVWGGAYADEGHYLHVYVSRLRRKLGEADPTGRARELVTAEPGVGYRVRDRDETDEAR